MSFGLENRVSIVERILAKVVRDIRDLVSRVQRAEQAQWNSAGGSGGASGGGGDFYVMAPSSGSWGATGTWPSLTAGNLGSLAVYQAQSGALAFVGNSTVYNYFPGTPVTSKIIQVKPDGAGNYNTGPQSCV